MIHLMSSDKQDLDIVFSIVCQALIALPQKGSELRYHIHGS